MVDEVFSFLTVNTVNKQAPSSVNTAYCHLLPKEKAEIMKIERYLITLRQNPPPFTREGIVLNNV